MRILDAVARQLCSHLIVAERKRHQDVIRELKARIDRLQQLRRVDVDRLRTLSEKNRSLGAKVRELYRRNVEYAARLASK